jgi:predicted enzyme related to lactoylglutathione lyase
MRPRLPEPVVHLELHTGRLPEARAFYAALCGWRPETEHTEHGDYERLDMGVGLGGGIVPCPGPRPLWLPYVEVPGIVDATRRARDLGAAVVLGPREGPAGWRSVVSSPAGGEVALWQQKR